jgi:hypothetical protein
MGVISSQRIKYAWGYGSTRTTLTYDEGAPVKGDVHVPIEKVIDGTSAPTVNQATPGILAGHVDIGGIYYLARVPMIWSPSHAKTVLDVLYENNTPGGSPTYTRTYDLSEVPSEPGEWMCFWKWTAKANNAVCQAARGGVVRGFALEIPQRGATTFTPEIAFYHKNDDLVGWQSGAFWDLPTTGECSPLLSSQVSLHHGEAGGGSTALAGFRGARITASWAIFPKFWASQEAHKISRGKVAITGEVTFRDTDDEIEVFNAYVEDQTVVKFILSDAIGGTGTGIIFNARIMSGGGYEAGGTRLGSYTLLMVRAESGGTPAPLAITISPDRA